jgi:hypothetical protein
MNVLNPRKGEISLFALNFQRLLFAPRLLALLYLVGMQTRKETFPLAHTHTHISNRILLRFCLQCCLSYDSVLLLQLHVFAYLIVTLLLICFCLLKFQFMEIKQV